MFEVSNNGDVLIKNSAILGDADSNEHEVKKAVHAMTAQQLVERFRKEAVLSFRERRAKIDLEKTTARQGSITEAAEKSSAKNLDELEKEVQEEILS